MVFSPLEQFEITTLISLKIFDFNFSITNFILFLFFMVGFICLWNLLSLFQATIIPNRWQLVIENIYNILSKLLFESIGLRGQIYLPFIYTLFFVILGCNLIGMVPYTFSLTSHIILTLTLAMVAFIAINIIGIVEHKFNFLSVFLPRDTSLILIPLLVGIEFISYNVKVLTLAIRLFANITSGHTLLKIIAGFAWSMLSIGGLFSVLYLIPALLLVALTGLELGISILQAYVFVLLICIYLNDVINLH